MQSNWNLHMLLLRIQNATATLESRSAVSHKLMSTLSPSNSTHRCLLKRNENTCPQKTTRICMATLFIMTKTGKTPNVQQIINE